jgi:hypothetical protein
LKKIKQLREAGSGIFCVDETWVDSNLTFSKCWQDESDEMCTRKGDLIILLVGSISGFLQNAELIYKAGNSTGDYHVNFKKWVRFLQNIP